MADSARIAEATILEIPVTIQGSQTVEGTERREMFTETTKTTLVFENGAAIILKARVLAGQSVFLRNELSGKEVLCRVIEVPAPGQPGCTELEFAAREPGFWAVPTSEPVAAAQQSGPPQATGALADGSVAAPGIESGAPTTLPVNVPEVAATPSSSASHEAAAAPSGPASAAVPDDAKEAEQLAGMVAKDAKALARRASAGKPAKEVAAAPPAAPTAELGETTAGTSKPAKALSPLALRLHGIRTYTLRKNPVAFGIAALVLVGAALGVAWRVKRSLSIHGGDRTATARAHSNTAMPTQPRGDNPGAPAQPTPKTEQPSFAQQPAVQLARNPGAVTTGAEATGSGKAVGTFAAPKVEASRSIVSPEQAESEQGSRGKPKGLVAKQVIPARIVSQAQPPLPSWAEALDTGDVVTLDAVIDEKGNVASATLLSGPHLLERAAKDAVELWIFEPTISNGKPIPTHMILTVEFQR